VETCGFCGEKLPPPVSQQRRNALARMGAFIADAGGRPRRFCDDACRQAAGRRRRAGLAENDRPEGRRGRVSLADRTRAEERDRWRQVADELRAAREELRDGDGNGGALPESDASVYERRGLLFVQTEEDEDEDDRL
jgi:hypothetical protein